MDNLIIIGASGHGKVIADIALKMNKWKNISFLDDDNTVKECLNLPVVGKSLDVSNYKETSDIVVAIGNNEIRSKIQEKLEYEEYSIATLVHPQAVLATDTYIENGTVIMAGVVINSSTRIGKGCILNTSCSVDHDNLIGNFVHISPGARLAGTVKVGEKSWIGAGGVVSNNINICANTNVGAGTLILSDIKHPGTYVGVPGRSLKNEENFNFGK